MELKIRDRDYVADGAGGQREGERGGCKGEGKELFELHGNILR